MTGERVRKGARRKEEVTTKTEYDEKVQEKEKIFTQSGRRKTTKNPGDRGVQNRKKKEPREKGELPLRRKI